MYHPALLYIFNNEWKDLEVLWLHWFLWSIWITIDMVSLLMFIFFSCFLHFYVPSICCFILHLSLLPLYSSPIPSALCLLSPCFLFPPLLHVGQWGGWWQGRQDDVVLQHQGKHSLYSSPGSLPLVWWVPSLWRLLGPKWIPSGASLGSFLFHMCLFAPVVLIFFSMLKCY